MCIFLDWIQLFTGAIIGWILSLLTYLFFWLVKQYRYKKNLSEYIGIYNQKTKAGDLLSDKVEISYFKNNVLEIIFHSKVNGQAQGKIIMDESTLKYGKVFYRHIDKGYENLSGFYDVMFFDAGIIHAKVSYIKADTRKEINEFYIWTRETINKK